MTRERVNYILSNISNDPISPVEVAVTIDSGLKGSRQKVEDDAFIKLYRKYSAPAVQDWVCIFNMHAG
jgi:hypothetical protein